MFKWKKSIRGETKLSSEQSGAYNGGATGAMMGIVAGVRVATAMGWRPVESVAVGDKVLTFDCGLQVVTGIQRKTLWNGQASCPRRFWPLEVPKGALGNRDVMALLPSQPVMVESDAAEDAFGDPFALMPAAALDGMNGISRVPPQGDIDIIVLQFAGDQIVFANSGALYLCPAAGDLVSDVFDVPSETVYEVLPLEAARSLTAMIDEEVCRAVWMQQPDIQAGAVA